MSQFNECNEKEGRIVNFNKCKFSTEEKGLQNLGSFILEYVESFCFQYNIIYFMQ